MRSMVQDLQSITTGAQNDAVTLPYLPDHPKWPDVGTVQAVICRANYEVDFVAFSKMNLGSLEPRRLENVRASTVLRTPDAVLKSVTIAFQQFEDLGRYRD